MADERLRNLIYTSTATAPFDDDALESIVRVSRVNNARRQVTGLLLHHDGRFMQVLEGPADTIGERMAVIRADPRHTDVTFLLDEPLAARRFPEWDMEWRPYPPAVAKGIPGYSAFFAAADASGDDMLAAVREMTRWFAARAAAQNW